MDFKSLNTTTCGICSRCYSYKEKVPGYGNWRSHIPLILHCAHSVCEFCIETALREHGKVCCPECKEESVTSQPVENVILDNQLRLEFPINIYILGELMMSASNIRSGYSSTLSSNLLTQVPSSNTSKKRDQCIECSQPVAILKCQQCSDKFCDSCFKAIHGSSKSLSRHIAVPLSSNSHFSLDEELLIKQTLPVTESKCLTHPSQYLVMYCNECHIAVCTSCFFKSHKEHTVLGIEEKNSSMVEDLKVASDNALPVLQRLKFNYQKLKSGAHSVHAPNASSMKELQQVEKKIRGAFINLHSLLQVKEKQLIHSLACFSNGTKKVTSDMMAEIQASIKILNSLLQNAQTVIQNPNLYSLDVDKLLERLKSVPDHTPCHIVTSQIDVNAAKPKFIIDFDSVKTALAQIELEIPENASPLSLLSTVDLPDGYSIPPIAPAVMKTSVPKLVTSPRPPSVMSMKSEKSDSNSLVGVPSTTSSPPSSSVMIIKDFGDIATSAPSAPAKAIIPGMPQEVTVVHIESPGDFYVQRKSAQRELDKMNYVIDSHYVHKQKPPNRVNLNDIYLAMFGGQWYRARVTSVLPPCGGRDASYTIFYIDFGNTDSVPQSKLRSCPPQIRAIPALALHCAMYDCVPTRTTLGRVWSPETVKYFVSLVLKEDDASSVSMQVYSVLPHTNQYCVDLHVLGDYDTVSVRNSLFALNYAREYSRGALSSASSVDSVMIEPGPPPCKASVSTMDGVSVTSETELPRNSLVDVCVSHIESPDYFCVHKASNLSAISRLSNELQVHYNDIHTHDSTVTAPDIVIGRIVACKLESNWYRGFISEKLVEEVGSELDPSVLVEEVKQVRVYCIDYGYKVLLPVENILKLHSKFFKMAAQALKCSLFGIAPVRVPLLAAPLDAVEKRQPTGWPDNIVEVLTEMMGAGRGVILSACSQNSKEKEGLQRVIMYHKDQCINKKLVDMKIAKAISPKLSTTRHKNNSQPTMSAPKKMMHTYREKIKKDKWAKKQKVVRKAQFGRVEVSSSDSSDQVSDLESDPEVDHQVDELRANYKQVAISNVEDPHHVYVTLCSRQKTLQEMSDSIQAHYKTLTQKKSDTPDWKVKDTCVVYCSVKSMYGRAVIRNISDEQAEVYFIDFGTRASVSLSSLQSIEEDYVKELDGTMACRLSGIVCADGTEVWPDYVVSKLRDVVDENRGFLYIYKSGDLKDGIVPVHLWVKKMKVAGPFSPSVTTWVCVNKLLVSEACAHATEPDEFTGIHFDSPYTSDTLCNSDAAQIISTQMKSAKAPLPPCGPRNTSPLDSTFPVAIHSAEVKDWLPPEPLSSLELTILPTYVDYQCRIYFVDPEKVELSSKIQSVLSAKYQNSSVRDSDYYWAEGQVCTVKYHLDECWYRGRIVQLEDEESKYGVYFVDYGNTESCTPSELRKEACYHEVPALAVFAILDGVEPIVIPGVENKEGWPTSTLDVVHKLIVDTAVDVVLLPPTVPGGPYLIQDMKMTSSGEDIIEVLVSSNLVKRTSGNTDQKSSSINKNQKSDSSRKDQKLDSSHKDQKLASASKDQKLDSSHKNQKEVEILPEEMHQLSLEPEAAEQDVEVQSDRTEDQGLAANINIPSLKDISWYEASEIESLCRAALNYSYPPAAISPREGAVLKVNVKYIVCMKPYVSVSVTLTEPINDEVRREMDQFTELQAAIQREASTQPMLRAPGPDMACIVCVEDEERTWYRARVLSESNPESPDIMPVLCVDTGVKEEVSRDSIRAVKEDWVHIPVQAITCIVHGVEVSPEADESLVMQELLDTLANQEEDYAFMKVKKCSYNGSLLVELFEDPETSVLLYQPLIDSASFFTEDIS